MTRRVVVAVACLLVVAPAMAQMYATTGGGFGSCCSLYTMSTTTGALTYVGTPNFGAAAPITLGMPGIDFTPDGRLFAVTGTDEFLTNSLVRLDPATGAVVDYVGALQGDQDDMRDLAIDPLTGAFFASSHDGNLYTINPLTAAVTAVGSDTGVTGPVAFTGDGTLYMAEMNPEESAALYTVNTSTGALSFVASLSRYYIALGRGPDDMLYAADFAGNAQWGDAGGTWGDVYRINPATGQETFLGSNGDYLIHDIAFRGEGAPVPTLTLLGAVLLSLGLLVLGWRRLAA